MRPAPLAPAALALAALAAAGCSSDAGRRAEAERVLHAVDRLVAADRGDKGPPLRALEAQPCEDPAICQAKATCLEAFRPLEESARLQREVRAAMAAGVASGEGARLPPDRALELFEKTDRAERAKQASERQLDGCLQAAARLRLTLRL
ncbi:MAG TPA: hypothetical protein VFS43_03375 [Polyangiaceae bacterium]|nr:hypothetical protein [Polyangiaceae bacterium]